MVREHNIWIRYAKDKGLQYDKKMEKWSAIHNTFKFFKMGRPPKLEAIEKSPTWRKRLNMMNIVKNNCKRKNLDASDFTGLTMKKIDEKLKEIVSVISKNGKRHRTGNRARSLSLAQRAEIEIVEGKGKSKLLQ